MENQNDKQPDWIAIRMAYESGEASDRALSREHGVSHQGIQWRAKYEQWKRPSGAKRDGRPVSRVDSVMEVPPVKVSSIVSGSAEHKAIIGRGRDLVERLLDELSATSTHIGEIDQMIEEETAGDRDGKRRYAMKQAVTLSTRAGVLKNLALAAKTLSEASPGKRDDAADAAKNASKGEFAVPDGPRLVANGR